MFAVDGDGERSVASRLRQIALRFAVHRHGGHLPICRGATIATTCDISIREEEAGTPVLNASFTAERAVMSDRTLARFALSYFAMGFKIIAGDPLGSPETLAQGYQGAPPWLGRRTSGLTMVDHSR